MKISRVRITNYKGIESCDFDVGPGGAIIKGKSRAGKTSIIDAIAAGLAGEGIDPSCIRNGHDRAEILIDLDHASVKRVIRRSGNGQLSTDGLGLGKPQSRLDELFGRLLDPLALSRVKGTARQKMVLEVMPATVTAEDLKRWTGEDWTAPIAGKHGLEVVAEVRKHFYDLRTEANSQAKETAAAHKAAEDEAERLASHEHVGVVIPLAGEEDAPVLEAEAARRQLDQRKHDAEAMAKRTEGTRAKIAKLREECALLCGPSSIRDTQGLACARAEFEEAKENFERARQRMEALKGALEKLEASDKAAKAMLDKAEQCHAQADELEETMTATSIEPPTLQELADADQHLFEMQRRADLVRSARAAHAALAKAAAIGDELSAAKAEAKRLDDIVATLTNSAQAELAERCQMIPGVSFVDDDIALDGKPFANLCGTEVIEVCTEVARRMNPKGKLIRVNGLEQMDPDTMDGFVKMATRDGFQLLGTRVERGELQIVAIEPDAEDVAAVPEKKKGSPRLKIVMPEEGGANGND